MARFTVKNGKTVLSDFQNPLQNRVVSSNNSSSSSVPTPSLPNLTPINSLLPDRQQFERNYRSNFNDFVRTSSDYYKKNYEKYKSEFEENKKALNDYMSSELNDPNYNHTDVWENYKFDYNGDSHLTEDGKISTNKQNDEERAKLYDELIKSDKYAELKKALDESQKNLVVSEYYYDKAKIEESEYNGLEAVGSAILDSIGQMFNLEPDNYTVLYNKNGTKIEEESLYSIKDKTIRDQLSGTSEFIYDVTKSGTKQLIALTLDTLAMGVPVGSVMYYGDIFQNTYDDSIHNGYDNVSSGIYSLVVTGGTVVMDKLLGSVLKGKNIKIGNKGVVIETLNDKLTKAFTKIIKNPKLASFLSNVLSEGGEEFLEEYFENVMSLLILDKSTDPKEYWDMITSTDVLSDALYAGAIGSILGGLFGDRVSEKEITSEIYESVKSDSDTKSDVKNNVENNKEIEYYESKKDAIQSEMNNPNTKYNKDTLAKVEKMVDSKIAELESKNEPVVETKKEVKETKSTEKTAKPIEKVSTKDAEIKNIEETEVKEAPKKETTKAELEKLKKEKEELDEAYKQLSANDKIKVDKIIELRKQLREGGSRSAINSQIAELMNGLSRNAKVYLSNHSRITAAFGRVDAPPIVKETPTSEPDEPVNDKEAFANKLKKTMKVEEEPKKVVKEEPKIDKKVEKEDKKVEKEEKKVEKVEKKPSEKKKKEQKQPIKKEEKIKEKAKKIKKSINKIKNTTTFSQRVIETESIVGELTESEILELENAYYDVKTNDSAVAYAKATVKKLGGYEKAMEAYVMNDSYHQDSYKSIALGQELLHEAIKRHDTKGINQLIAIMSPELSRAGQTAQLAALYRAMKPEHMLMVLNRNIERLKENNVKGAEKLELTEAQIERIISVPEGDTDAMVEAYNEVASELAASLPSKWYEKLHTFRVFAMLSGPGTHIKNLSSNFIMKNALMKVKNTVGATIEKAVRKANPDFFESDVRPESEIYDNQKKKIELKEIKAKISSLIKKANSTKSKSVEYRREAYEVTKTLKGEAKIKAVYNQIGDISKELEGIDSEIIELNNGFNESKASYKGTKTEQNNLEKTHNKILELENKRKELINIKNDLMFLMPKGYASKSIGKMSDDVKNVSKKYVEEEISFMFNGSKYDGKSFDDIERFKNTFGENIITKDVQKDLKNKKYKDAIKKIEINWKKQGLGEKGLKKALAKFDSSLETLTQLNSFLLEMEDNMSKNKIATNAFGRMLMANGIDEKINKIKESDGYKNAVDKEAYLYDTLKSENQNLFNAATDYAMEQALEGTFQQANAFAEFLNYPRRHSSDNKGMAATNAVIDATLPFRKTNLNIAKTMYEYSPAGLLKSLTTGYKNLKDGKISANKFIDDISKGVTGTGVLLLGNLLRKLGVLGRDDDDENYVINVGDKQLTIDWSGPTGGILAQGYELGEVVDSLFDENGEFSVNELSSQMFGMIRPYTEMTVISALNDIMNDYRYGAMSGDEIGGVKNVVEGIIGDFISSFFPQAGATINKVIDPTVRTTTPSRNSTWTLGEKILNNILYRTVGMSKYLEPKTDMWGQEQTQRGNVVTRIWDNVISPWTVKERQLTDMKELSDLYEATGKDSLLPTEFTGTITYDGTSYKTSDTERTKYKKTYGQIAHDGLSGLFDSSEYSNMTSEQIESAISNIYKYANDKAKQEYFDSKGIAYESSSKWMRGIEENNIQVYEYAIFKSKINTEEDSDEKFYSTRDAIADYTGTNLQKAYLYTSIYPNAEESSDIIVNSNISFDKYLDLKGRTRNLKADTNSEGESISGSKKKKVLREIANTKGLTNEQKFLLTYLEGYAINNGDYIGISKNYARQVVVDYVKKLNLTKDDKLAILDKAGYKILKNGNVSW